LDEELVLADAEDGKGHDLDFAHLGVSAFS
jgi:hypothetical protein